jgi:hypothetical protein
MLLLLILYRLVLFAQFDRGAGRRDLSKNAALLVLRQENTVLRRQIARVALHARRPGVVGQLISAHATSPGKLVAVALAHAGLVLEVPIQSPARRLRDAAPVARRL